MMGRAGAISAPKVAEEKRNNRSDERRLRTTTDSRIAPITIIIMSDVKILLKKYLYY